MLNCIVISISMEFTIMDLRINKSMENDNDDDDDGYSDTSDEATFEVQRYVVHIDKGEIQ